MHYTHTGAWTDWTFTHETTTTTTTTTAAVTLLVPSSQHVAHLFLLVDKETGRKKQTQQVTGRVLGECDDDGGEVRTKTDSAGDQTLTLVHRDELDTTAQTGRPPRYSDSSGGTRQQGQLSRLTVGAT